MTKLLDMHTFKRLVLPALIRPGGDGWEFGALRATPLGAVQAR